MGSCLYCQKPGKLTVCTQHAKDADALFLKPPWTKFVKGFVHQDLVRQGFLEAWTNSRYQVFIRRDETENGELVHLSIKRNDKLPIHDWRDLQRIKNEILGPEEEAMELYPSESRLLDGANQYHLWCFTGKRAPFGYEERLVAEGCTGGAIQRPFEKDARPDDVVDSKVIDEKIAELNERARHGESEEQGI